MQLNTLLDGLSDHKQKYSKWGLYIFGYEYSLHLIMFSQFESQFESKFTSKSIKSNHFVSLKEKIMMSRVKKWIINLNDCQRIITHS